jgi:hypothetical protein
MKKLILTARAASCAVGVFAQGTVGFANRAAGNVITHVYLGGTSQIVGNGSNDYSDSTLTPGTVNWSAYSALVNLAGANVYEAQLLAAPGAGAGESSLVPASPVTPFRTTTGGAGWVQNTTATLGNVLPDAAVASIEMVAWDNTSGLYPTWVQAKAAWQQGLIAAGEGGIFNLNAIGGTLNPAPTLNGLQSFNIFLVPEPTTFALLGLGGAAVLIFRRRK